MLKIKNIDELLKHNFEQINDLYLIRYIQDNLDYFDKGGTVNDNMEYYRTLYVDKDTKEIFAYNDYLDEKIPMQDKWIKDIADLVEKVGE